MQSPALTSLVAGLGLLSLLGMTGPNQTDSRVCAGAMKTVVCVPPEMPPQPPTAPTPPSTPTPPA